MMEYSVHVISDADEDIFSIYRYIVSNDSAARAEDVLNNIEESCFSLKEFPERGHIPPELERIGIKAYREIHYKPYRIIYQVVKNNVYIHCVIDGRRDMMDILQERLLR